MLFNRIVYVSSFGLVLTMLFLSFSSKAQMWAELPLAEMEVPGYPTGNATLPTHRRTQSNALHHLGPLSS